MGNSMMSHNALANNQPATKRDLKELETKLIYNMKQLETKLTLKLTAIITAIIGLFTAFGHLLQ